jgi:two-component system sensor histidine kinase/response regulator
MVDLLLRRLSVRRRIVGGFLVLVLLLASTIPLIVTDHNFIVGRIQDVTNVVSRADRLLLLASTRVTSSRVNLLRYLDDYLPSVAFALEDAEQAADILAKAKKLISSSMQLSSVTLVQDMLGDYERLVRDVQAARLQEGIHEGSRKAFLALKSGNDIGQMIEHIVEDSEVHVASTNKAVFATARVSLLTIVAGYVGALFLSLILAGFVSRSITRPVAELRRGAEAIRQGHMGNDIPVAGRDELSMLAGTFNQMVRELRETTVSRDMLIQEITERKRVEEALRRQNEVQETLHKAIQTEKAYLEQLFESAQEAIVMVDRDDTISRVNSEFTRIFGYTRDEALGKSIDDLIVPEDLRDEADSVTKRAGRGERVALETIRQRNDGARIDVSVLASPIMVGDEQVGRYSIYRDITERKRAQEALRESEERFRALVEESPVGVTLIGMDGRYEYLNPSFVEMFGYNPEDLSTGKEWFRKAFPDPEYRKHVISAWKSELEKIKVGESTPRTFEVTCKNGSQKTVLFRPVVLREGGQLVISEDITERKQSEAALRESEERYRAVFENTGTATIIIEEDTTLSMVNTEFEHLTGYPKEEVEGKKSWTEFVVQEDLARMKDYHAKRRENGWEGPNAYEFRLIDKHENMKNIWIKVAVIPGTKKSVASLMDITSLKRAEETIQIEKAYLEQLFESAQEAIGMIDNEGAIMRVNSEFTRIFGYTGDEALGKSINDLIVPADLRDEAVSLQKRSRGERVAFETIRQRKDGALIDVSILASPIKVGGELVARYGIYRDITERKRSEEALRESEERYRSLFEDSIDAIYVTTLDGGFVDANQSMLELFGYSREEMVAFNAEQLFVDREDLKRFRKNIEEKGFVRDFEVTSRKRDGAEISCLFNASLRRAGDGAIVGYQGIIRDITARKQAEKELQQAKEEAEAASHAKTEFLASMSHEIRTPMNAIIGMADLLQETPLTPEQHQYVQVFSSAGENLLSIINDILDISKVEAGHLDLEAVAFDLREIAENTCDVQALRAHEKGLELACHVMPDIPAQLLGDPVRLRQILMNLVGNAIKFTEEGEVIVEVKSQSPGRKKRGAGEIELLFSVADTGIGIPPEKINIVFDSFTQADTSTTREHGGTGLGLTISKRLAELMGGRIWVESQVGKGSTFYFTARFQVQAEPGRDIQRAAVDMKGMKVLVVDDNEANRIILGRMLSRSGALVSEAEDGEGGIAEIKRAVNANDPYGLLLLDCRMPGMDGFEVVEHLKRELDVPQMTIMMLTSDRRSGDIDRCRELQIARYLVKPVKQSELLDAITAAIGKKKIAAEEPAVTKPAAPEDLRPLHILLVEDSQDNRLLIQSFLQKTPYRIDIAENGEIAVDKFTSGKYDLVLMDMQMPVMDGYTATREIRKWEAKEKAEPTPIVALTAYATKDEEQKSLDAGCNAHLTKPIKKVKLLEALRTHSQSA